MKDRGDFDRMRHFSALTALLASVAVATAQGVWAATTMPAANLPPQPNYDAVCRAVNGLVVSGYCAFDPATNRWTVDTPAREDAAIAAINNARGAEGLPPLLLPSGFQSLPSDEQQFILVNLERIARGLPPLVAITPALDLAAQAGAGADQDPQVPAGFAQFAYGANWAGDEQSAVAMYGYMYLDGWGGSSGETVNVDCTGPTAPGCWGHRLNVLGDWGQAGLFGAAGLPGGPTGTGTSAQLYVGYTGAPLPVTYTWEQALAAGAAGGLSQTSTDPGPLWPFQDMTHTTWAAGPAAVLASVGVVQGTGNADFSPDAPVQLQEMVTFLGRVLGWSGSTAPAPAGTAQYAAGFMAFASAHGLLPAGVAPAASLTRLETVGLLVSALGLPPASAPMPFSDLGGLSASDLQALTTAVADGLLQGEGNGILAPAQGLTRAQAVVLLQRSLLLRARSGGAVGVGAAALSAQALSNGWELYQLGAFRLLAAGATQDPFMYWQQPAQGPVDALLASAGAWWAGTFVWQPEQPPSWAPAHGTTLYGSAQALIWPAGQQGVGPALFNPTTQLIAFGQDVQELLPGAKTWITAPQLAATEPELALAAAIHP